MLNFEIKKSGLVGEELEIHADFEGIESLIAQLDLLRTKKTEHVHLMAESWGGSHLADQPTDPESVSIKHVKIYLEPAVRLP